MRGTQPLPYSCVRVELHIKEAVFKYRIHIAYSLLIIIKANKQKKKHYLVIFSNKTSIQSFTCLKINAEKDNYIKNYH